MHAPMGNIIREIRQLSALVASMVETQREHTQIINKMLSWFKKVEVHIGALEDAARGDEGT